MNDPIADKIVERITKKAQSALRDRMEARHRELRAMSTSELEAELEKQKAICRELGMDPDELLRV
jgi:hypothetical protein